MLIGDALAGTAIALPLTLGVGTTLAKLDPALFGTLSGARDAPAWQAIAHAEIKLKTERTANERPITLFE